ncbi:MAG: hypothetical protein P8X74_23490 [Reinekea sp.]
MTQDQDFNQTATSVRLLGQVSKIDQHGRILQVITDSEQRLNIADQSTSIPRVTLHARCIIERIGDLNIVTHVLLSDDQPFTIGLINNKLLLEAGDCCDGIEIRTGSVQLELLASGQITLQGQNIEANADGNISLLASSISLN